MADKPTESPPMESQDATNNQQKGWYRFDKILG